MKSFQNILVSVDARADAHPIVDEAAHIATLSGATLKLIDVVPEFPWTARLMIKEHGELRQILGRDVQTKLDALAASLRDQGIDVETQVLWGKTSVEIIREVLRGRHDLVLSVAKGRESRQKGFFGTTGQRLLRDCPCAVWLVASTATPGYKHVMGCIDTSTGHDLDRDLNSKVYELTTTIGRQQNARMSVVHAWGVDAEQFLAGRMAPRDFEQLLDQRQEYVEQMLTTFLESQDIGTDGPEIHLLKDDPAHAIPLFARENDVDLIVMGTVARSGLLGMVIGNTAERILNDITCSVLAVKPDRFVSPITEGEYIGTSRKPDPSDGEHAAAAADR